MRPVFHENGQEFYCTFSVGIAFPQTNRISEEDLLRDADIAMCAAKARGEGKWAVFDVSMQQEQTNRLQLDNDLRKAVQESQFEVYYQPIVILETGVIQGFEALVRWNHPTHGVISPGVFIPVAEQTGLINEIGLWVLREACRQALSWNQQRSELTPHYVAVNLSARQCKDPRLIENVSAILEATGLPPECLHLELTESMVCEEMTETSKVLEALKRLRIGLKIDDFGTGYSSLQHLAKLPFDTLKIDLSFVRDMNADNPDSIELVRSILMMAKGLNMEVIAEGIETIEQSRLLDEMGCRFGQGYLFSKPAPARMIETMLATEPGTALRSAQERGLRPC
jgi:EAL domain-containing protein (putative c-di-GMP-specific phosphodiesterase class I)